MPKYRRFTDRGAQYLIPNLGGPPMPSVTTILNEYPARDLETWRLFHISRWAVENQELWSQLPPEDAVKLLRNSAANYTEKRANIGTAVHKLIEEGATLDDRMTEDAVGYLVAAAKVTARFKGLVNQEITAINQKDWYAGTADVFTHLEDGRFAVIDWKTSKRLSVRAALQLYALAACPEIVVGDGEIQELQRPKVGLAVRLAPDGDYEIKEVDFTDQDLWKRLERTWLGLRLIYDFNNGKGVWS